MSVVIRRVSFEATVGSRRCTSVAKAGNRVIITMACIDCKMRNYSTMKNRKNDSGRIELKKFCPTCGHHTTHRETR